MGDILPGSYAEYLALVRQQERRDRERWEGDAPRRRPPHDPLHPFDGDLPPTGNAAYDAARPYRQAHGRSAIRAAGFDEGALARLRRKLQGDPYGPNLHIVGDDGEIRPAEDKGGETPTA
jgi:hypothetical protein